MLCFATKLGFRHILQQNVVLKIAKFVAKWNNSTGKKNFLFQSAYIFATTDIVNIDPVALSMINHGMCMA